MIISIQYYLGDNNEFKYFETYKEMVLFVQKLQKVKNSDQTHCELTIFTGKEETRMKKFIADEARLR